MSAALRTTIPEDNACLDGRLMILDFAVFSSGSKGLEQLRSHASNGLEACCAKKIWRPKPCIDPVVIARE